MYDEAHIMKNITQPHQTNTVTYILQGFNSGRQAVLSTQEARKTAKEVCTQIEVLK